MPEPTKTPQPEMLPTKRSEKFIKAYSNAVNIEVNVWDFTLVFGEIEKSGERPIVEQSIAIVMSPQHAKVLAGVLANQVKEYEKSIGEIKLPQAEPEPLSAKERTPAAIKSA